MAVSGRPPAGRVSGASTLLAKTVPAVYAAARFVGALALLGELAVILADVIGRALFDHSFLWSDEAARLALATIAFIGGAVAYRDGRHAAVELLPRALPPLPRAALAATIEATVAWTAGFAAWGSLELLDAQWVNATPILEIPVGLYVVPLTLGLSLIALFSAERLALRHAPIAALLAVLLVGGLGAALFAAAPFAWLADHAGISLGAVIGLLFGTIFLGLPVSMAMLLATLLYLATTDIAPVVALPQNMLDGVSSFIMLALPFFIFAGSIMEKGGISIRLVRLAMRLVGRLRGGLLQVVVVTVYLISGISGSKVADVAAVGAVVRDELRRRGYRLEEGAAVLASSAAMAETIPPSIAMLVLGSVTPISVGTLFVAGLLPAAVLAICLMALILVLARRTEVLPETAADARLPWARTAAGAILPLAMPAAMFFGIRFGIATPTEVSSFAVIYGVALATMVYREMDLRSIMASAGGCAAHAGTVLFVLAVASAFAWVLSAANLPQALVALLHAAGDNRAAFLVGSVLLLIVIGSLLEGLPAIMILAPLLLPLAIQLGINDVQYGIVLILAMGIGAFMPPIGIGFYVAVSVAGCAPEGAARAMLPYLAVLVLGVLLIALVPEITLALPNVLAR